jgi:subtilisin-like proprotein convertase family protein
VRRSRLARAGATIALAALACAVVVSPASGKTRTKTYSSGPIAAPITDAGLNLYPISSKGKGKVKKVRVAVRITHAFDADLDIYLVSPRAKFVQLSTDNGGRDNDYGAGTADCTGTFTTFNDAAATPITAGAAPFAGGFKPQQPLSVLKRSKAAGQWQLLVIDDDPRDTGTLGCWQLTISAKK